MPTLFPSSPLGLWVTSPCLLTQLLQSELKNVSLCFSHWSWFYQLGAICNKLGVGFGTWLHITFFKIVPELHASAWVSVVLRTRLRLVCLVSAPALSGSKASICICAKGNQPLSLPVGLSQSVPRTKSSTSQASASAEIAFLSREDKEGSSQGLVHPETIHESLVEPRA